MDDENKDQEQQNNLIRRNADQINDAIRKKVKENAKKNAAAKSKWNHNVSNHYARNGYGQNQVYRKNNS